MTHEARGTKHEARILVMAMIAVCSSVALAMPTQQELKKAQPLVAELMAPIMDDFKAKRKTAAEVADVAVKYAGEAETEAAKFMLYRSSIPYYVRGEAYDKAAEAVVKMKANVKSVPAEVVAEIISKATVRANKEKAPRLFELYQQAKTQATAEKDVKELRKKPASTTNKRKLAEALATTGNWQEALKEFVSLTDQTAQMAKGEQDGSAKSAALGEFWWSYKPTYENADDTFKIHAAVHYRKALAAGEITGLKKNIVEQRIKEYGNAAEVAGGMTGGQGTGVGPRTPAATGLYCVIDLSGGPDAKKYPVSYLSDMPKGGWSDEYKTTKLVLRRVESGTFKMGKSGDGRRVEISKPFYVGVFEVTQKQWDLVMDDCPSFWKGPHWQVRPVEGVTYIRIRGNNLGLKWPESDEVDSDSFLGRIRQKTGLRFDLPTEAQWEYACRAGTETDYNNGCDKTNSTKDSAMDKIGRYGKNGGWNEDTWGLDFSKADRNCETNFGTAAVGSYQPNRWGLFDMSGNVHEQCLDRGEGKSVILRGGNWWSPAIKATSWFKHGTYYDKGRPDTGFRLVLVSEWKAKQNAGGAVLSASAATASSTGSIELKTGGDSPFAVKGNEATLTLKSGVKLEFVKCPSGLVKVVDDYEKKSTRKVRITRPFWIMKRCLWKNDVKKEVQLRDSYCEDGVQIHPPFTRVEGFCADLTDDLKAVIPAGYVVRLPSIAEWEYAYHAGSEDPDDEPFGSLLCTHPWEMFNKHTGKTPVNKWGLYDFHVVEKVLDRMDKKSIKVFEKDSEQIVRLPDCESKEDLFYWNDAETAATLVRCSPLMKLLIQGGGIGSVRLVIGPDLVSEWKAKNGKK